MEERLHASFTQLDAQIDTFARRLVMNAPAARPPRSMRNGRTGRRSTRSRAAASRGSLSASRLDDDPPPGGAAHSCLGSSCLDEVVICPARSPELLEPFSRFVRAALRESVFEALVGQVVADVAANPGTSGRKIRSRLSVRPASVLCALDAAEQRGLVVRLPGPRNGRCWYATDAGGRA
jgi:hypothetical protein